MLLKCYVPGITYGIALDAASQGQDKGYHAFAVTYNHPMPVFSNSSIYALDTNFF